MISRGDAKLVRALHRRKTREAEALFLAEGVRVVEEALTARLDLLMVIVAPSLVDTERGRQLVERAEAMGLVRRVAEGEFASLAATEAPQGVLAVARVPEVELRTLHVPASGVAVVLDGIQDPGNFGAIVRSADAFRALCLAALPGTVDPWNPKAVRAAAGSSFRLPILQLQTAELLEWLSGNGLALIGAEASGTPVDELPIPARTALVFGNEGAGLSVDLRERLDASVSVPIRGAAESLNVGVAAGILLYLFSRHT